VNADSHPISIVPEWAWLLASDTKEIVLPNLTLRARDHDPPVLVGEGRISISDPARFPYTIRGRPADLAYAMDKFKHARANPYDTLAQFRIEGVDDSGAEWSGGYTHPDRIEFEDDNWVLMGEAQRLLTDVKLPPTASGVELVYLAPREIWLGALMNEEGPSPLLTHAVDLFGSRIAFRYDPRGNLLFARAQTSSDLRHPFLENWIGEPLRILLGQLIYPRLSVRHFGDGRAMVALNPSPRYVRDAGFAALCPDVRDPNNREKFWGLYRKLLAMIARAEGFEAHNVTRYYEEIIQAARGSHWVWALTLASASEGLARIIAPSLCIEDDEALAKQIDAMVTYIRKGPGPKRLVQRATGSLHGLKATTAPVALRYLRDQGDILDAQYRAWRKLRNSVMHGDLVEPWPTAETDSLLADLAGLMHALTMRIATAVET
jgi:hypothetical protein